MYEKNLTDSDRMMNIDFRMGRWRQRDEVGKNHIDIHNYCQSPNFYLEYGLSWILILILKPTEQTCMDQWWEYVINQWVSKCGSCGISITWKRKKYKYSSPTPDLLNREVGMGPSNRHFNKPSVWFWCTLKIEHHY